MLDGHQAQRGDAQALQMVEHRGLGEAGVGAAQGCRDARVQPGLPADVQFIEHAVAGSDACMAR
jgi:hypothetical protein